MTPATLRGGRHHSPTRDTLHRGPSRLAHGAAPARAPRHRALPDRRSGRSSRSRVPRCGHRAISFNSCRNRHCPKCLTHARNQWLAERAPRAAAGRVRPRRLHPAARAGGAGAAEQTGRLRPAVPGERGDAPGGRAHAEASRRRARLAQRPPHLGTDARYTTRTSTASCPRAGSRPTARGGSMRARRFFLPVKVLRRVFRGKFVAGLRAAFRAGRLTMPRDLQRLHTEPAFAAWLRTLFRHEWVVYAKPPFGGPSTCCTIWPGTRTGSRSPTID